MKIRSMQTCIMSSLPRCIFRCSVFRYVTLVSFFFQTLLFNCNSFTLVANKYLLTYLLTQLCCTMPMISMGKQTNSLCPKSIRPRFTPGQLEFVWTCSFSISEQTALEIRQLWQVCLVSVGRVELMVMYHGVKNNYELNVAVKLVCAKKTEGNVNVIV